jgi:hypothetical protein
VSVYEDMALCQKRAVRRMCAEAFGIEEHRLVGASRLRKLVIARQATYFVLKTRFPEMSYPRIARLMGGRDHSTIIYGVRTIQDRMARDPALRQVVAALIKGSLPRDHNAHVMCWRSYVSIDARREEVRMAASAEEIEDDELAEFVDPGKVFCEQCDRSLTIDAAARCAARICGLRAASRISA